MSFAQRSCSSRLFSDSKDHRVAFEIDDSKSTEDILADYMIHMNERTKHHLGYPYNLSFEYGERGVWFGV